MSRRTGSASSTGRISRRSTARTTRSRPSPSAAGLIGVAANEATGKTYAANFFAGTLSAIVE
jgi:hypothetical protein